MRRHIIPLTLTVAALTLTGCGAQQDPAPTAIVTVTATPSAETHTATPEATATTETPAAETIQPTEPETPAAAPTAAEEAPAPTATETPAAAAPAELVSSEGMQGDDYTIYMNHDVPSGRAQAVASNLLAAKLAELRGTPQAEGIDLVAVYGPEYELLAMEQVTPHPQCAGCTIPPSTPAP
ncbi:hypothetical protein OG312_10475 [Kocuria rhizophila]|uniref:hypothetical protein n=1 Tax=Kocuria rhizophila TaxID=72000 RepID=UPI002E10CED4|nr:hypothetical protein OG312_10475 [Kocuria rhizophila]